MVATCVFEFHVQFFGAPTPRLQRIHKLDREKRAENTQNKSATTSPAVWMIRVG